MRFFMITLIFCALPLFAIDWGIKGQASVWNTTNFEDFKNTQIGVRYIPEASLSQNITTNSFIDAELSLNTFGSYIFKSKKDNTNFSTYRAWVRYSTSQFEARFGVQQIKFGPAMILRPLMWFDQLDVRDPLQFTKGVTGGLLRYYFLNNANIWLWGLVANDETKGLEILPSEKNSFEFGGRFQYPVGPGELALTYHHRKADIKQFFNNWPYMIPAIYRLNLDPRPENRYALDGKWDVGIGLWFESVLVHKEVDYFTLDYQKYMTIGADYTFGLGNGLHVLGEHMMFTISKELNDFEDRTEFTAVLADYSLTLWDMLMGIVYYNWETNESYKFLTWRRTYDNWSLNAALYWNPDNPSSMAGLSEAEASSFGAGKGFQLMVIFNH